MASLKTGVLLDLHGGKAWAGEAVPFYLSCPVERIGPGKRCPSRDDQKLATGVDHRRIRYVPPQLLGQGLGTATYVRSGNVRFCEPAYFKYNTSEGQKTAHDAANIPTANFVTRLEVPASSTPVASSGMGTPYCYTRRVSARLATPLRDGDARSAWQQV